MSNEWYTPAPIIEAARVVMGSIDLDPASSELANKTVKAMRYFTLATDGLMQPWSGNVWLNPPYTQIRKGHSSIRAWVDKAVRCYTLGSINQCMLLIPNDTSTRWFNWLWEYPICFPPSRIKFEIPGRKREQPTFGTCIVYMGMHEERFTETFRPFGRIVRAIHHEAVAPVNLDLWEVPA